MRTLLAALALGFMISAKAQTTETSAQKIGYADTEYILTQMPKFKQIDNELKTHGTQLENQLKAKYEDYQAKVKAYQSMPATTPDAIKADKERELQALQENIQKFQQDAQSSIQKKQAELMDPIYKQIGKAIEDVAKENGFSFILQPQLANGGDVLLYSDDKFNISTLVLKKLGVTPTAATTPTTTPVKNN
jgi:outer membrane protein